MFRDGRIIELPLDHYSRERRSGSPRARRTAVSLLAEAEPGEAGAEVGTEEEEAEEVTNSY